MGTDIHAFVEIDYSRDSEPFGENAAIRPFNGGEFFLWRNYDLFNALGDGRNYRFSEDEIEKHSRYPPRGLPSQCSYAVYNRYFHLVDDGSYDSRLEPSLPRISKEKADEWLRDGLSTLGPPNAKLQRVSNPDWHSPSWLTLDEIYRSLAHFGLNINDVKPDFRIVVQTMKLFEEELGPGRTRLVFWFDN